MLRPGFTKKLPESVQLPLLAAQYALLPIACEWLFSFFIELYSAHAVRGGFLFDPEELYFYFLPAWLLSLGVLRVARRSRSRSARIAWLVFLFLWAGILTPIE